MSSSLESPIADHGVPGRIFMRQAHVRWHTRPPSVNQGLISLICVTRSRNATVEMEQHGSFVPLQ